MLGALGAQVFPTGPLGSGHAMKALNNFVGATTYVITAEALAIGRHYGLTPATMIGVFNASTARSFNSEVVFKEHVVSGRYATAFALVWMTERSFHQLTVQDEPVAREELVEALAGIWQRTVYG